MIKFVVLLFMVRCTLCTNKSSTLEAAPISFPASEIWDGNDGPWSSFGMQVGTPSQNLRLLPSNSGNAVWPVLPQGSQHFLNLDQYWTLWSGFDRGSRLGIEYSGNADFGYDNLTLGWLGGGLPALSRQVIEGFATKDFYIGTFGLSPDAVNISTLDDPQPSFLAALALQNSTPSPSWAYTAGAYYRQPTAFGSLTLGGYDTARFVQNNVTFPFGPDISRDLLVPIQSIKSDAANGPLLSTVIYSYIDSLVPHIWLPLEACQAFEKAFGLTYNETAELYFVNDTLHDKLVDQNPNVTFTLGPALAGGSTVDIVMGYGSFDLMAEYPIVNNQTRYFPLRQAQNDTQYTLGRTFLQDAYVIADYDRSNFSVSQAVFPNGSNAQQIVAIRRPNDPLPLPTQHKTLSTDDVVGIVIAAVVSSSIITATIVRYIVRKGTKDHASKIIAGGKGIDKAELKGTEKGHCLEMPGAEPKELIEGEAQRPELPIQPGFPVYEMPEPPTELEDTSLEHAH